MAALEVVNPPPGDWRSWWGDSRALVLQQGRAPRIWTFAAAPAPSPTVREQLKKALSAA